MYDGLKSIAACMDPKSQAESQHCCHYRSGKEINLCAQFDLDHVSQARLHVALHERVSVEQREVRQRIDHLHACVSVSRRGIECKDANNTADNIWNGPASLMTTEMATDHFAH